MVPPTGVSSFPVIITWGMEKLVGSRQGVGRHRMLCLDQVPSLWQEREGICVANWYPSSHLESEKVKVKKRKSDLEKPYRPP